MLLLLLSDNHLRGIPDLSGLIYGKGFAIELKVVRNNKISLQPRQTLMIEYYEKAGGIAGFLLYYPKNDKYAIFTYDEIERKCYKKENFPVDIPLWNKQELTDWFLASFSKRQLNFRLAAMR